MNTIPMGRRSFVRGLSVIGAAAALPAAATVAAIAAPRPEHPNDKVRRLAGEIMDALNDPEFLGFRQVTITPTMAMYQDAEQDMPADERASLHFASFAEAMNELTPDAHGWIFHAGDRNTGGAVGHIDGRWANGWAVVLERELTPRPKGGPIFIDGARDLPTGLCFRAPSLRTVPAIPTVRRRT